MTAIVKYLVSTKKNTLEMAPQVLPYTHSIQYPQKSLYWEEKNTVEKLLYQLPGLLKFTFIFTLTKTNFFFVIKVTSTRLNIEDYIDYINIEA